MPAGNLVAVSRGQFLALADEGQLMCNALRFFGEDNDRCFACYSYWVNGDLWYVGRTMHSVQARLRAHFLSGSRATSDFPIRVTWTTYRNQVEMEDAENALIQAGRAVTANGLCNVQGNSSCFQPSYG